MHPSDGRIRNRDVLNNKLEIVRSLMNSDNSTVTTSFSKNNEENTVADLMEAVTSESSRSNSSSSSSNNNNSSEASWLPGLILAVVSSLILILFLVTLLVSRLPRLQKWLSPILIRIAPPTANNINEDYRGKEPSSSSSADFTANAHHGVLRHHQGGRQGEGDLVSGGYQHSICQYQSGSRNRPSRPSSLPCLPEEKLSYYQHPSYSSTASTTTGSVLATAATAAAITAQATAVPHRPHSFYPPAQQLFDDDGEDDEEDEDVLLSVVGSSTVTAQPPVAGTTGHHQSRGRHHQQQRKLNLTLHSDGSEASNSSSSASGVSAVDHRSSGPIVTNEAMNLRQRSANQHNHQRDASPNKNHPTRAASEAGSGSSRQSSTEQHHPFRRHQLIDRQEDGARRLQHDDWTAVGKTSSGSYHHHHPSIQRQSSLVETDCDRCRSTGKKDEHHLHLEKGNDVQQQHQPASKIPDVVVVDIDHQGADEQEAAVSYSSDESLPLSDDTVYDLLC